MAESKTLRQFLSFYLPRLATDSDCPDWPPDLFGLMSVLLEKTGGYLKALEEWPPTSYSDPAQYTETVTRTAKDWRKSYNGKGVLPQLVHSYWESLWREGAGKNIVTFGQDLELCQNALMLMAIADQASAELALLRQVETLMPFQATRAIVERRTLGLEIGGDQLLILPKRRTPQTGLNVRSLSLHICAIRVTETRSHWHADAAMTGNSEGSSRHCFNMLLVPWPEKVDPNCFREVFGSPQVMRNMARDRFGYMTYYAASRSFPKLVSRIEALLRRAQASCEKIDAIVFPESALTPSEFAKLANALNKKNLDVMLIAGVSQAANAEAGQGENFMGFVSPRQRPIQQNKHHRWQLTRDQILQYHLGSSLSPSKCYWENIPVRERQVNFIQTAPWLLVAPLICEDLARPDPVGEVIRAVGPDLVIALLMDGPQLANRWAARNAVTLADDPGCAVLSLTSAGMVDLSNIGRRDARRVIALYKDPVTGLKEIELPPDKEAILLTLSREPRIEWTADGRKEESLDSHPILSGWYPI